MDASLVKKLLLKPGQRVLIVNAPDGYLERLSPLPEGSALASPGTAGCDWAQLFLQDKAQVDALVPGILGSLKPGAVLWLSYPKRGPKVHTDINRDTGWDAAGSAGWGPVTQIAIDDTWSALRFRPNADVKSRRDQA